jgi:Transcriptional regulator/sugar kinase
MQIGIDLGATKIEHVLLDDKGTEIIREREKSPTDYISTIDCISKIVNKVDEKFNSKFEVGICHPGSISNETGLLNNATNSPWLNNKPFQNDITKNLSRNVFCENDANCFALSESIDGSAKHYNIVFGVILGSGCGGGLVVNKKIVKGANNLSGEWGHSYFPSENGTIEDFLSGTSLSRIFEKKNNIKLKAFEIFELYRKKDTQAEKIIEKYKESLAISLCYVINILDPDAIVFGGGVSNEITFFDEVKKKIENQLKVNKLNTAFIKPMYEDASGVRGAARLGRKINY